MINLLPSLDQFLSSISFLSSTPWYKFLSSITVVYPAEFTLMSSVDPTTTLPGHQQASLTHPWDALARTDSGDGRHWRRSCIGRAAHAMGLGCRGARWVWLGVHVQGLGWPRVCVLGLGWEACDDVEGKWTEGLGGREAGLRWCDGQRDVVEELVGALDESVRAWPVPPGKAKQQR